MSKEITEAGQLIRIMDICGNGEGKNFMKD